MTRLWWLVALAAVLTGCSDQPHVHPHYVDLPDHRKVLCVWEKQGYGGGLSCDWNGAR